MSQIIDKSTDLTSDVYGINSYVNRLKKEFTSDVNEDTLMLGIFGYMGQVFSDMLQNTVVMASEFSNESIPTKAKFEKNIISHALGLGITDINAIPASFDVLLTFIEDDINKWALSKQTNGNTELVWEFIFDKDTPIYIGDLEFHTDYDISIKKLKVSGDSNKFSYTAKYLIDIDNPISDIKNPYLTSPVKMMVNGSSVIFTKCTLHQVEKTSIYKKVLSDNSIASKTITFEYTGQLAAFTMDVVEGSKTTHLIPVYEGLSTDNKKYPYFYYNYIDSNTIRIKFDRYSYAPRINSDVTINIQTTSGEDGNFTYNSSSHLGFSMQSERLGYSNIGCEIRPITGESANGTNKKSIEDLKKVIPKEALSRGSITNTADLENFFNMINTSNSMLYFYKKRDNALERLYHSFIVMKDKYNVICPTNTISIKIEKDINEESSKQIIDKNKYFKLVDGIGTPCNILEETSNYSDDFIYTTPYNLVINMNPLYGMYFLTTIDINKFLEFNYINEECLYQYIATSIKWYRGYTADNNEYSLTIDLEQNLNDNDLLYDTKTIRCIAVFYDEDNNPIRWAESSLLTHIQSVNIFKFQFKFETDDYVDSFNRIRITKGLYDIGTFNESYAHFNANCKCIIHIISKQGEEYGLNELDKIIPELEGYSLSNSYNVIDGVDFFYNYSDVVNSTVTVEKEDDKEFFIVKDVPVVKYNYFNNDEDKAIAFCSELIKRKNYIDYASSVLEDAFGMDFKFFNTYGPSKLFTTDNATSYLNKTNLSFTFRIKLRVNYDVNVINNIIADIKKYIEDINSINTIHMTNLVTHITTNYTESIEYFEFVDINGYGPSVQHIYSMPMPDEVIVPEFVNIMALEDGSPDITLIMM